MSEIAAHERVVVHRPADAVWRILADYARDPEWRAAVVAMVPDPAGTVVVGTTTAETLRLGGRTQHIDGLVTEVSAGRRFAWRTTSGTPAHGAREVTDLGGGRTRVDLHLSVTPRGGERVLRPLLVPLVRRTLRADADRLRVLAETAVPAEAGELASRSPGPGRDGDPVLVALHEDAGRRPDAGQ